MAAPFVIAPKGDVTIDNGVVQMNVLLEPGRAEGFAVFVSTFPPLGGGPPSHHHDSYDEAFYVLSGDGGARTSIGLPSLAISRSASFACDHLVINDGLPPKEDCL